MVQIIAILLIQQLVISESSNRFSPQIPKMFCSNKQPMPDKTLLFLANSVQNVSSKVLNPQCKIILLLLFYVRASIYSQASLGCILFEPSLHNTISYL